ncbi:MAG: substrate-binding domain-containing protein [Eggerthella sp.]|nr:substrate-binding domain-containing protein [Eggerthella sp.]
MARSLVGKGSLATKLVLTLVAACMAISLGWLVGCSSGEKQQEGSGQNTEDISVYSREDGSGTRGAFIELFGLEEKDDQGNKVDTTTDAAAITNSTSVMMTSVKGDPGAIGYISLGSLDDSVKSLKIDGVEATADNVKDGSYKIARPFNIVTTDELTPAAQDFITFIMSKEGQTIVEDNGYIAVSEDAASYTPTGTSEKIVVAGSSSVTPVMEKLAEAYEQANPEATIEVQQSDSTTGVTMAIEGTCDIGMASRELKDSEMGKGAQSQAIARDGIAVIVPVESAIEGLTSDQVKQIFSGKITSWGDVK